MFETFLSVGNLKPKLEWFFKPKLKSKLSIELDPSRAKVRGGLSSCRAGQYSGFMTDGDDVYDINPLKKANVSGEEMQGSPPHHHLIRKTRGQIQ